MAETVDTTCEASPADGFQALGPNDLSDLESAASIDIPIQEPAEAASGRRPVTATGVQAESRAAASLAEQADGFGGKGVAPAKNAGTQLPNASREAQSAVSVLREAPVRSPKTAEKSSVKTRRAVQAACGVILVLAVASGVWLYTRHPHLQPSDIQPRLITEEVVVNPEKPSSSSNQPVTAGDAHFAWEAKFREIDTLRQTLLAKKEEILRLQQNYQYGVLELEEEVARLIRKGGFDSLAQALKNRRIELALQSIQRRCSYRDNLEKPLHWIDLGSEELLFLQRRAFFDLQLKDIAEHIDMNAHMADIDSALIRYQPTVEKLSINNSVAPQLSLEGLWKRLAEQAKHVDTSAEDQRNQDIIAEVCSGNLGRLSDLSRLTLEGARCLAESGARQLFLSRLSGMTPATAGKLCEWPGQWLGLNGIVQLSPELASQLFAWPGEWMSLNGLSEVPDEAAKHLVKWKGRQLELMGLRKPTGIEFLAQWEVSGGRLFVPDDIRREIEKFRRTTQPPAQARNPGRS